MLYRLGMTEAEVITEIGERLAAVVPAGSQVVSVRFARARRSWRGIGLRPPCDRAVR
jgi:hypothetical protein